MSTPPGPPKTSKWAPEMLYDRSRLKYEAVIGYEAAYYQIPKEHFERKPQVSRMDLPTGSKNKMQQASTDVTKSSSSSSSSSDA